jgi:hypothetical protein
MNARVLKCLRASSVRSCKRAFRLPYVQAYKLALNRKYYSKYWHACHRASSPNFQHVCVNECMSVRICACKRVSRRVWMVACVSVRLLASRNWRMQSFDKAKVIADKRAVPLVWMRASILAFISRAFNWDSCNLACMPEWLSSVELWVRPILHETIHTCYPSCMGVSVSLGQLCRFQTSVLAYIYEYKRSLFCKACLLATTLLASKRSRFCVSWQRTWLRETMRANYCSFNLLCKKECLCESHCEWNLEGIPRACHNVFEH